jgi:serine/threonine protein kinase
VSSSSRENYPISDEPTRDFMSVDGDDDSMEFDDPPDTMLTIEIPDRIGDYAIKRLIGTGGMGQVYLAEHVRMQRAVAIKMLKSDRMADQAAIDRFYEEVRAVSRLMHPNIVAAFDAGEFEGIHYLAMEYVDGMTLTKIVSKQGPLSVGEAVSVIRQAALGLLHAHRAGIVHRDVKPGNIMRAADGTIKVLDLGLAHIGAALLTESGQPINQKDREDLKGRLIGTLAYMSPEQLESPESIDSRTDIYSLGAVLYFLLTARPPFVGEYLDQVYGHRHGEIPDLMQVRDDTDLNFANIFRRMMAKTPDERYASLDEVIDDLSDYSDAASTPLWLAEFSQRQAQGEASTVSGGSTSTSTTNVMALDVGMSYACVSEATALGEVSLLSAGGGHQTLFRTMIASDNNQLVFDQQAQAMRMENPKQSLHCLPMYIGKDFVDREVCGQKCPPEVLLALVMRRAIKNAWKSKSLPNAVALTVPASYDQLHRRSFLQAAEMAGLKSVRLVDRSVAAVQSLYLEPHLEPLDTENVQLEPVEGKTILYLGLTGQASEIALFRHESGRLQQLATAGHWHTGSIAWLQRLVTLVSEAFIAEHQFDPRKSARVGSRLQMACERAMNSLLLLPSASISIEHEGTTKKVVIQRADWLLLAKSLIDGLDRNVDTVLEQASVSPEQVDLCVSLGPLIRIADVSQQLLRRFAENLEVEHVDRASVSRGAAACLASELPGRSGFISPPRCVSSQSIGIVVEDVRGRTRILPIIPRGTALPARTNRRLTVGKDRPSMSLSLVESSGVTGDDWHSLGRHTFEIGDDEQSRLKRTRMIGFEVNVNGMLTVRAQTPGQHGSITLPSLPKPVLSEDAIPGWIEWMSNLQ